MKYRVSRDSPEDKLRDFMNWMISVRKEIIHLVVHVFSTHEVVYMYLLLDSPA